MRFATYLPLLALLTAPILAQPLERQYTEGQGQVQASHGTRTGSCGRNRKHKHKNGTASASATSTPVVPIAVPVESAVVSSEPGVSSSTATSAEATTAAAPAAGTTTATSPVISEVATSTPGVVLIVTPTTAAPAATSSPVTSQPQQAGSDAAPAGDAQTMLKLHNDFRAKYGAGALTWNSTLVKYASDYASGCQFKHSGGPYGENLAAGVGGGYTVTSGFNAWAAEASKYNYNSPGFAMNTGHFTQVVWKATTQVGCAVVKCKDGTIFSNMGGQQSSYIICEYKKPGNMVGNNGQYFRDNVGTLQG